MKAPGPKGPRRRAGRASAALALAAVTAAALALAPRTADALPRFAARNGTHCWTCHVNPTGGGMRSEYGKNAFELTRLAFPPLAELGGFGTRAGGILSSWMDNPSFGIDTRFAYLWVERLEDEAGVVVNAPVDGFFAMQADLYARLRIGRWAEIYLDKGVTGGFETFVLLDFRRRGYLKAGRFTPPYGLKLDSHTTWVRDRLGLGPQARDSGVEAGLYLGPLQVTAMVTRSALSPDRTSAGSWGVSGIAVLAGALGPVRCHGGLSFARRPRQAGPVSAVPYTSTLDVSEGLEETMGGAFLGLAIGRLSYLVEVDVVLTGERAVKGSPPIRSVVAYHELAFLVAQGIDLAGLFEYLEPDLAVANGAAWRFGGFVELFPLPFLELRLMYRHTRAVALGVAGEDDVVVMLHGFF